ncbi:MAG: response regulator [Thermoleophilia bacterium]|nr:response regulator [Thermoleophilia bacterium]
MEGNPNQPIRVVVADDSAVMRRLIGDALRADPRLEVVGEAGDGDAAITRCRELRADVLTLDLSMPGMNGLEALAELRRSRDRVRVVVVSAFSPSLIERALDVLDEGATDLVAKPRPGGSFQEFGTSVVEAVVAAAAGRAATAGASHGLRRVPMPRSTRRSANAGRILAIASSTGGPRALGEVVPKLGATLQAGGVIVQHMPEGFTTALARRLDQNSQLTIREGSMGDALAPDTILIAPAGWHMRMRRGVVGLDDTPAIGGVRPRADVTIEDLVADYGARIVLVVLTGMGNDGLLGARAVRAAGGIVIAQDERDCVVYGMPRHVVENDLADATGTLDELPTLIERALGTPLPRQR